MSTVHVFNLQKHSKILEITKPWRVTKHSFDWHFLLRKKPFLLGFSNTLVRRKKQGCFSNTLFAFCFAYITAKRKDITSLFFLLLTPLTFRRDVWVFGSDISEAERGEVMSFLFADMSGCQGWQTKKRFFRYLISIRYLKLTNLFE